MSESSRVAQIARRIVFMFQFYKQNIDPDDEVFVTFVSNYLERKKVNVKTISYYELYTHVKNAIREYLQTGDSKPRNDA
ncbi:MAG TPA: hypothetical protein VMU35_04165 [Methylomirabilota bacterium]|nr:hypothetical protein [Methylomirabilota bacterium]